MTRLLPWHAEQFEGLCARQQEGRLGHAWLLSGPQGSGKLDLARHLANTLLCSAAMVTGACGACTSCQLFAVGTHPDFRQVQPEKALIKVDQIRETIEFAQNTSQRGGMKILVFEPAEAMNQNAANALLKLLEEPPAGTLLLLVSHQAGLLLPTIRSRCQVLRLPMPAIAAAESWLAAQGLGPTAALALRKAAGAPLRALAEAEAGTQADHQVILECMQGLASGCLQPVEAAKKCEKSSIIATIDYLLQCCTDLCSHLQGRQSLRDPDLQVLAELLHGPGAINALHGLHHSLQEARKVALAPNNASPQLMLEALFSGWRQTAGKSRHTSGNRS